MKLSTCIGSSVLAVALVVGGVSAAAVGGAGVSVTVEPEPMSKGDPVTLVFKTGRTLEGVFLDQTADRVFVEVTISGITVKTDYPLADLLTINRRDADEATAADEADEVDPRDVRPSEERDGAVGDAEHRLYVVPLSGEFGRDVSYTPLRKILDDARDAHPDVLVLEIDCEYKMYGVEREEYEPRHIIPAFFQLETVRQFGVMLTDEIRDDPRWEPKPRVVAWVHKALGGVAFMPFLCPEIYYAPEGRHGGIGYLDRMFEGVGDEVVQEKQYSLQLGRAEALANKSGYPWQIIRAMSRSDYQLSVSFDGGEPVFHDDGTGDLLLTDDGKDDNEDKPEDIIRYRGNDVLTLDSELALRLGLSRGTVDSLKDLAYQLGVSRSYEVVDGKAGRIFENWSRAIDGAEKNFRRYWREFGRIQVGGDYRERTQARGQQLRILRQIHSELDRYGEAINPYAIQGAPENWNTNIRLMIEQIEQQQRMDGPP